MISRLTHGLVTRLILATLVACAAPACSGEPTPTSPLDLPERLRGPGEGGYVMVVEGYEGDQGLRIIGEEWDGVWVRGCRIEGASGDGIFIRDVARVKISGCEISDVGGQGGIRLSATGGSEDVLIEDNHIHDVAENGVNASQRASEGVHHQRLVIRGNLIERTGLEGTEGLTHGLYIQSRGAIIEANTVRDSMDGNGISIRSTAHVHRNIVSGWAKSGIRYYTDHDRGEDPVLIESNILRGGGSGAALEARFATETPEEFVAERVSVRFNTVASTNDEAAIAIDEAIASRAEVSVEGNLMAGGVEGAQGANATLDPTQTAEARGPLDLRLTAAHPERGAYDSLEAPVRDVDDQPRPVTGRDPGADQYTQGHSTPTRPLRSE